MGLGVIHHLQPWVKVALRFVEGWHCSLQTNMFFSSIFPPPYISTNLLRGYREASGDPIGQGETVNFIFQVGKKRLREDPQDHIAQMRKTRS